MKLGTKIYNLVQKQQIFIQKNLRRAMDVIYDFYYIHGPMEY